MTGVDDSISLTETRLSLLRDAGEFCDVIIRVSDAQNHAENDGVIFKAHKLLLVASIPYFHSLHADGQWEHVVTLPPCVDPWSFSIVLDYVYFIPLSPRLIYSSLFHDPPQALLSFPVVLDKLIATSTFFGLNHLTERLTKWSRDAGLLSALESSPIIKCEVPEVEGERNLQLPVVKQNGCGSPYQPFEDHDANDDDLNVKRDLNSLEAEAVNSNPVVTVKRVNLDDLKLEPEETEPLSEESSPPKKRRKRRRKVFTLPKPKEKRARRDPMVKKTWTPGNKRKVLSRDLLDASMSIHQRSTSPDNVTSDASNQPPPLSPLPPANGLDLSTASALNPASGVLELNGGAPPHPDALPQPVHPPENSGIKTLSADDLKSFFKNPRDLQSVKKRRLLAHVDQPEGDQNSWHHAVDHPESFLGKIIPFGNSGSKIWEDGKRVGGEIRGLTYNHALELKKEDGTVYNNIICPKEGENVGCPFCVFTMRRPSSYKMGTHFLNHHGYVWIDIALLCNLCSFITVTGKNLRDHLHRYHSVFQAKEERTLFLCRNCGKRFRFRESRLTHERACLAGKLKKKGNGKKSWLDRMREPTPDVEQEEKPDSHVCSLCGKGYKSAICLENHMCREHGKAKRFTCTVEGCSFGTNVKDPFYDHLYSAHKINIGAKPILQCKHCDYSTVRKHTFDKHQLTHGQYDYNLKCVMEGCDKMFRQAKDMRSHYRTCHVDLSLKCQFCDSVFRTEMKLRTHEKVMHTHRVRNFKCAYCSHATVQRTNCRTHIKSVHRGLPVTVIDLEKLGVVPAPEPPVPGMLQKMN